MEKVKKIMEKVRIKIKKKLIIQERIWKKKIQTIIKLQQRKQLNIKLTTVKHEKINKKI